MLGPLLKHTFHPYFHKYTSYLVLMLSFRALTAQTILVKFYIYEYMLSRVQKGTWATFRS